MTHISGDIGRYRRYRAISSDIRVILGIFQHHLLPSTPLPGPHPTPTAPQVSVSLASTCQPMGDWSDTQTGYGKRSARNGRSFNLNKPDSVSDTFSRLFLPGSSRTLHPFPPQGPIKCACRDLGPYNYNPNTRSGEVSIYQIKAESNLVL